MTSGWTKLHSTILDSSVWQEPAHVRLVWITMLAMADADGVIEASIGGLAHRARVTREECVEALQRFLGPDPDSRDGTTGERIEALTGGWLVLNHASYRDKQTHQQAATAERVRRHRQRLRGEALPTVTERYVTPGNAPLRPVTQHLPTSPSEAEADAEADTDAMEGRKEGGVLSVVEQRGAGRARSTAKPASAGDGLDRMGMGGGS
jgi:hypothetical protein